MKSSLPGVDFLGLLFIYNKGVHKKFVLFVSVLKVVSIKRPLNSLKFCNIKTHLLFSHQVLFKISLDKVNNRTYVPLKQTTMMQQTSKFPHWKFTNKICPSRSRVGFFLERTKELKKKHTISSIMVLICFRRSVNNGMVS